MTLFAGKVHEAGQLCCQAGQAWRCLSLAGGGTWGPLPLGEAAAEAAQQMDQHVSATAGGGQAQWSLLVLVK